MKSSLKTNAIKSFGKTVENDIKSLEKVLNIKFPNDYKHFLSKQMVAVFLMIIPNEIVLRNIGKIINIDILYGVNMIIHALILNTGQRNILMIYLQKTVIIGDSLQNGFIVMICDGNNDGFIITMIHII